MRARLYAASEVENGIQKNIPTEKLIESGDGALRVRCSMLSARVSMCTSAQPYAQRIFNQCLNHAVVVQHPPPTTLGEGIV